MTQTDICNLALGYLGVAPIATMGDTSTQGVLCASFYPMVRQALLEGRNWTFAMKTWQVTKSITPPVSVKYSAAYPLDAACIRVHRCDDGGGYYRIGWERVGTDVLTDDTPASLYIEGLDGAVLEVNFSYAFILALAAALAVEICIPLTENATLWGSLVQLAEVKLKTASGSDGRQGKSETIRSDSLARRR